MKLSSNTWAILIGGLIPAILYGLSTISMKAGAGHKISTSNYLMIIGIVIFLVGLAVKPLFANTDIPISWQGIGFSILSGIFWVLGTALVNYSILKFDTPIAILTPLYNMNTLVAVVGGMILFAEWKTVHSIPIFLGTVLVMFGGILLSKA